jgi:hypothetical protein
MKPVPKRNGLIVVDLSDQGKIVARDARGQPVPVQISEALKQRLQPTAKSATVELPPAPGTIIIQKGTVIVPGTMMPDGTIYIGRSPDTGRAFYAAANDAPGELTWFAAMEYARSSTAHDHSDWRLPSLSELNILFNNRAAIGGFNESGLGPAVWYWSSSSYLKHYARNKSFSDGVQVVNSKGFGLSARCVRG